MPGRTAGRLRPRIPSQRGTGGRERLTEFGGLAALSTDALGSVAYGPEAMVVALVAAGTAATSFTFPLTVAIAVLLIVLVVSYRQVISVHPSGGGSYAVAKKDLGSTISTFAAACLVVDYVLTVAVSLSAGAGSIASVFPALGGHLLPMALAGLVVITAVNLWGIAESARMLMIPVFAFVALVLGMVVVGLLRGHPAAHVGGPLPIHPTETIGVVLILKAFSAGCSALTGVEAIANGTPEFQDPRVRRAQRTELMLGILLGAMLIGLSWIITRDHIAPRSGVTILAQISGGAYGSGWLFTVTNLVTALVLGLAANTSFGGLPVLLSLLARDHRLPHLFAVRSRQPVYRFGIVVLAVFAAILLIAVDATTARLIPLYAIGVFISFTISQAGLVRHWRSERSRRWRTRAALNALGAVMTAVATIVFLITKFTAGAWIVVLIIPLLMVLFMRIQAYYRAVDRELDLKESRPLRKAPAGVVIIPVNAIDKLTALALEAALALGPDVIAVSVHDNDAACSAFRKRWERWSPGLRLETLPSPEHSLIHPIVQFVRQQRMQCRVTVLIPEAEPQHWRYWFLRDPRSRILATLLLAEEGVIVCTYPYRLASR